MDLPHVIVRPEQTGDAPAISRVLESAFPEPVEARLVEALRADGDITLSLVAVAGTELIGVSVFSRVSIPTPTGDIAGVILAPVAVAPSYQRHGHGSALVTEGLRRMAPAAAFAVVLGDPAWYGQFGFSLATGEQLPSPWSGPYWQAVIWDTAAIPPTPAPLQFPRAFAPFLAPAD